MDPLPPIVPVRPSVAPAGRVRATDPDAHPNSGDEPTGRPPRRRPATRPPVGPPAGKLADEFADGSEPLDDEDDGRPHVDVTA